MTHATLTLNLVTALMLLFSGAQAVAAANQAGQPLMSGEQAYSRVCSACHETGVANAPKFGDKKAWAPLIAEGQHVLTAHAWVGVRAMPARGGSPDLSLEEFARGVAWMSSNAGSTWMDPDARMMGLIRREAEKRLVIEIREKQKMKKELHQLNMQAGRAEVR